MTLSDDRISKILSLKDKIKVLRSRIALLENLFEEPAIDVKERKLREGLLVYASDLCSDWMLKPS